ncbi:hypothetical protein [Rahnella aceris]
MASGKEVRSAITQSKFNEENSGVLLAEIFIISAVCGFVGSSWWAFGGSLILLFIILSVKVLSQIFMVVLSLGWGLVGYGIGSVFGSVGAMVVLSVIGFICGLGLHLSGLQWLKDLNND